MTRISKNPEERKAEILDAAMELFLVNGYEKTSVSDIVQRVNVAQGLFYYYFKSKEEVFRAALERFANSFAAKLIAMIRDRTLPLKSRIEKVIHAMMRLFTQSDGTLTKEIQQTQFSDMDNRLSLHITRSLVEPVAEVLMDMNERGSTLIKNPQMTATFLVFGIFGLIHGEDDHLHNREYLEPDALIGMISGLLGVKPEVLSKM